MKSVFEKCLGPFVPEYIVSRFANPRLYSITDPQDVRPQRDDFYAALKAIAG